MSAAGWPYTEEQWTKDNSSGLHACELCGCVNHSEGHVHADCRDAAAADDGEHHAVGCAVWIGDECDCEWEAK